MGRRELRWRHHYLPFAARALPFPPRFVFLLHFFPPLHPRFANPQPASASDEARSPIHHHITLDHPTSLHIHLAASAMAPPPKPAESSTNKKKVTPAEVAFLVDRYLAENGFNAALAAFRSEAAHIYSPTKYSKKTPKRLIPLADILHDYIALKEARVAIESAMQAMQSLVSTYYASGSSSAAPPHMNINMNMMMPPLPPPHAATGAQPSSPPLFFYAPNSSSPPSQGIIAIALQCPSPVWFFSALLTALLLQEPPATPRLSFITTLTHPPRALSTTPPQICPLQLPPLCPLIKRGRLQGRPPPLQPPRDPALLLIQPPTQRVHMTTFLHIALLSLYLSF